jgi:hypothetical protein
VRFSRKPDADTIAAQSHDVEKMIDALATICEIAEIVGV